MVRPVVVIVPVWVIAPLVVRVNAPSLSAIVPNTIPLASFTVRALSAVVAPAVVSADSEVTLVFTVLPPAEDARLRVRLVAVMVFVESSILPLFKKLSYR